MNGSERYRLSVAAGLIALVCAVGLAFVFYYVVGYPLNVPLALGTSVLLVELVEAVARHRFRASDVAGTAILHAFLVAGAAWLGSLVVGLIG